MKIARHQTAAGAQCQVTVCHQEEQQLQRAKGSLKVTFFAIVFVYLFCFCTSNDIELRHHSENQSMTKGHRSSLCMVVTINEVLSRNFRNPFPSDLLFMSPWLQIEGIDTSVCPLAEPT